MSISTVHLATSYIVITGIKQPDEIAANEIEHKGYVIHSRNINKKTMISSYMLTLTETLVMQIAIDLDFNIKKDFSEYNANKQLTILNKAIKDLLDNIVLKNGGKTSIHGGIM